jgi:hypothetical protein
LAGTTFLSLNNERDLSEGDETENVTHS